MVNEFEEIKIKRFVNWLYLKKFVTKYQALRIVNLKLYGKLTCFICEKPIYKSQKKNIDHFVPLSKGGTNNLLNLSITHVKCNSKKANIVLVEVN